MNFQLNFHNQIVASGHNSFACISRSAAKIRLQALPSSDIEAIQLQRALMKTSGIAEVCLPHRCYKIDATSEDKLLGGFGPSEHRDIGAQIKLKGLPDGDVALLTNGGVKLGFGDIVALAGDYYGIAGAAISLPGGSDADKTERFKRAFETLEDANSVQLKKIKFEIEQEACAVQHSGLPHHCYSNQLTSKHEAIKKIKEDIDDLLVDNSDHFFNQAKEAYRIGHTYAMDVAGRANGQIDQLKRAYAIDAYACHFLTDLFSAGHIRNQRGDLETFLKTTFLYTILDRPGEIKALAAVLTGAQHEKDGNEGLNVANGLGERWRAYGDGSFFMPRNRVNREQIIRATQTSANEIHAAFQEGNVPHSSRVDQHIPKALELNAPPLYRVEGNSLFIEQEGQILRLDHYLRKAIPLALKHLPETYVNGFIKARVEKWLKLEFNFDWPLLDKVVIPNYDRITGFIWRIVGVASFRQINQENQQLNDKIDEISSVLKEIDSDSQIIQRKIDEINNKLDQLLYHQLFDELNRSLAEIRDEIHRFENFPGQYNDAMLKNMETNMKNCFVRLSRIFSEGTRENRQQFMFRYGERLTLDHPGSSAAEIKLLMTLWYRQMLDFQVLAFSLSRFAELKLDPRQGPVIRGAVLEFNTNLVRQVEHNKEFIDSNLIDESKAYISLQLEKQRIRDAVRIAIPAPGQRQ